MHPTMRVEQTDSSSAIHSFNFLAFHLGGEEYGIDIQKVQELRSYDTVTGIANAPEFIKAAPDVGGVIDTVYLTGLGTIEERTLNLVDIDRLIEELAAHPMRMTGKRFI